MCPASTAVISRARLERIPLHCGATSMLRPGRWKIVPSRRTGTPVSGNSRPTNSAEPSCSAAITRCSAGRGSGIMKSRKRSGKRAALYARVPKSSRKDPLMRTTTEPATSAYTSLRLHPGAAAAAAASRRTPRPVSAPPGAKAYEAPGKISLRCRKMR